LFKTITDLQVLGSEPTAQPFRAEVGVEAFSEALILARIADEA